LHLQLNLTGIFTTDCQLRLFSQAFLQLTVS